MVEVTAVRGRLTQTGSLLAQRGRSLLLSGLALRCNICFQQSLALSRLLTTFRCFSFTFRGRLSCWFLRRFDGESVTRWTTQVDMAGGLVLESWMRPYGH